ncbi:hypothetical protein SMF913_11105 [Streptomyces malaysiensis]|uniref:Uncharacterized protein n=1 Tax=Streptomyces malaysiensis TaxID=92644 RepID=A0A2J7Z477_STRMQ|nr:hypothetical protein SMF913_11105 [Streptomyces malaysiensis]
MSSEMDVSEVDVFRGPCASHCGVHGVAAARAGKRPRRRPVAAVRSVAWSWSWSRPRNRNRTRTRNRSRP